MVNVSGMSSNMPSPDEWMLEVISLNAISRLNGCLTYAAAALYPGMNEAKGNSPPSLFCFIYCLRKMFVFTFAPGAAACEIGTELGYSRNPSSDVRLRLISTKHILLMSLRAVTSSGKKGDVVKHPPVLPYYDAFFKTFHWKKTTDSEGSGIFLAHTERRKKPQMTANQQQNEGSVIRVGQKTIND